MESSDNRIDPENEVKKLQALVKKLERQNELLRSKQNCRGLESERSERLLSNGDVEKCARRTAHNVHSHQGNAYPSSNAQKYNVTGVGLEDVDVIDVDKLSLKDEDSWLYSSPKPLTPQQSSVDVYQWVRQDFDHPSPELLLARRSLLSKLDEVARMNRSCSSPVLGSTMPGVKTSALSRSTEDSHSQHTEGTHRKHSSAHHRHSMMSTTGIRVENGTFSRRKKVEEVNGVVSGDRSEEGSYLMRESTDVERLARQQEESLRQSMATYTSPKRVLHNKSMSMASDTDTSASPAGSNRSSPGRFDYEGSFFSHHRNSFGSDCSTPPDSPGIMQHSTPCTTGANSRSRLQYPPPLTHSSDSSLDQPMTDSTDDLLLAAAETRPTSRLQGPGFRSASPIGAGVNSRMSTGVNNCQGMLLLPNRGSGLPTPRRSIPRPALAPSAVKSSLPMPRRPGIPSPRQSWAAERDQSWRDGCF